MVNFFVIKVKRNLIPFIFLFFTISMLIFSNSNISAVKSGLSLWATSIVPSLFPFFVSTELLMHTNIPIILGNILDKYMKPLFNVNGAGSFAFIMGLISGYPMGAKIACEFRKNNICSKEECERLLSFTNNSGPLFIIGTIGISMYRSSTIGFLLFISHFLSCIIVGFIFRFWKNKNNKINNKFNTIGYIQKKNSVSFSNLGEIMAESITKSISTMLLIGGFVVIFSSIISILKTSGLINLFSSILFPILKTFDIDFSFAAPVFTGLLEITTGINSISNIPCKKISQNIIFTSFLLGLGGVSVFLQVFSIVSKSDLSIKPYIYGKLLQSIFSVFITFSLINIFPFFNLDI